MAEAATVVVASALEELEPEPETETVLSLFVVVVVVVVEEDVEPVLPKAMIPVKTVATTVSPAHTPILPEAQTVDTAPAQAEVSAAVKSKYQPLLPILIVSLFITGKAIEAESKTAKDKSLDLENQVGDIVFRCVCFDIVVSIVILVSDGFFIII